MKSNSSLGMLLLCLFSLVSCTAVVVDSSLPIDHPANRLAKQSPLADMLDTLHAEPVTVQAVESAHEHHH